MNSLYSANANRNTLFMKIEVNFRQLLSLILLSAIAVFYISCSSTKKFDVVPERMLTATSIHLLNGRFQNRGEISSQFYSCLWAQLTPFNKDSIGEWTQTFVDFKVEDKFLKVSLLNDTAILKSQKFKYKLRNGSVVIKNTRLQGVPLIFYRYEKIKNRISIDKDDNLRMYLRGSTEGGIFIFIFGSPIIANYKFLRLK